MLIAINEPNQVREYQRKFETMLSKYLTKKGECTLGFQGGKFDNEIAFNKKIFWSNFEMTLEEHGETPRFWNGFGSYIKGSVSQNIGVEINIPTTGINRTISGLFACDAETKDAFLLHRGRLGGGRPGIGKKAFKNWYRGQWVEVLEDGRNSEVILITSLYSEQSIKNITHFICQVEQFKLEATKKYPKSLKTGKRKISRL